jgi:hypothetical protein
LISFNVFGLREYRVKNGCRFLFLLLGLFCCGCGPRLASLPVLPEAGQVPIHREFSPLPSNPVCRVAVLPFENDSGFPQAGAIFADTFAAQLNASGDYLLLQQGDILKSFQQLQLLPGVAPSLEEMQIIAHRVDAQVLITGVILEMVESSRGDVKVVVEVEVRDGATGETLWTTFHRRLGTDYTLTMHLGTIYSVTGLSRQMSEEIINLWLKKGFTQCNATS